MSEPLPTDPDAALAEGARLLRAGRYAEAEAAFRDAAAERPHQALHNLGVLYRSTGDLAAAETAFRQALENSPNPAVTEFSLGMLLMSLGRWAEGWPFYEARETVLRLWRPEGPAQRWDGQPLAGRTLAVVGEQGLGDQLQFVRYMRGLDGPAAVVCGQPLARLFEANGIRPLPAAAASHADAWCFLLSLPRLTRRPDPIWHGPYLSARASGGGGVGLVTRGDPNNRNDANRSLPQPLAHRLAAETGALSLHPQDTGARDFQDTAEIVAGLDLVITVDTSVAHLAGAMGRPVWILLPHVGLDWRWLHERADTPWYPSARLYRQPRPGDWTSVVDRLLADFRREQV